jgi:hypothetical protein
MTLNINSAIKSVYLPGVYTQYTEFFVTLISKYNNKGIDNTAYPTGYQIPTTLVRTGNDWSEFELTFPTDWAREIDLEGYYDFRLFGREGNIIVERNKWLCKVINSYETSNPDYHYQSNNENNEQYTYFE